MEADRQQFKRLNAAGNSPSLRAVFGRLVTIVLGGVLLASTLLLSMMLFAILLAVGLIGWGYLWWKTRAVRKVMREQMQQAMAQQRENAGTVTVIEGEYVREERR
jgi:ABC-type bacteriocin/lantibiotic exporter with double-glycine peptidase domain